MSQSTLPNKPRVAVIGAGIIGLSTAVLLTEILNNSEITLIAQKFSPDITSDIAGAIILPLDDPSLGSTEPRKKSWNESTFKYLYELLASPQAVNLDISLVQMYEIFGEDVEDPWWKDFVLGFRHVGEEEMKVLHYPVDKKCWCFSTISMSCGPFLQWQLQTFKDNGGVVIQRKLENLQEIDGFYDVIVNCTGLGSRKLFNDDHLFAVKGQHVIVKAPWIKHALSHEVESLVYIIPRRDVVVLGGVVEIGNWSEHVDPVVSRQIMERCCKFIPGLSKAEVIKEVAGLRPGRNKVRLEIDETAMKKSTVVHNYGHGGQGVTLFRGCAEETVQLVRKCLQEKGF